MNLKTFFRLLAISLILSVTHVTASDLEVGEISLLSKNWGNQTAAFDLNNNSDEYKFVVATSLAKFTTGKFETPRFTKKSFFVEPASQNHFELPVIIPTGYGKISVEISLYDVVDTLDQLFDSQKFKTTSMQLSFDIPQSLKDEVSSDIILPKFVEDNELFDNYFMRAILVLIYEGKTANEIASICGAEPGFITSTIKELQDEGLVSPNGSSFSLDFIVIDSQEVNELRPAIAKTIDQLYGVLKSNLHDYDSCLAAMVADGRLSGDKNDALDMGTILYQKYPVMLGLFLWDILGREFVNNGKPFNIFENSEPCNAKMGDFMYMVTGDSDLKGNSYYYLDYGQTNQIIYCGLGQHNFECQPAYRSVAKRGQKARWGFDNKRPDMVFIYNEDKIREPLSMLLDSTSEYVLELGSQLDKTLAGENYDKYKRGARYWCWDIVVTKLMNKFESDKIIKKEDLGIYRFQKVDF